MTKIQAMEFASKVNSISNQITNRKPTTEVLIIEQTQMAECILSAVVFPLVISQFDDMTNGNNSLTKEWKAIKKDMLNMI